MVYEKTNLVYLKELWGMNIHSIVNSNLGVLHEVEIHSTNEDNEYDENNRVYIEFIDGTGEVRKYTLVYAEYDGSELSLTVKNLVKPIVLEVDNLDDRNTVTENAVKEFDKFNIANVFEDNVLDLTDYDAIFDDGVPDILAKEGQRYIDIDTEVAPAAMIFYTAKGMCPVKKIIEDHTDNSYTVIFENNSGIKFAPKI